MLVAVALAGVATWQGGHCPGDMAVPAMGAVAAHSTVGTGESVAEESGGTASARPGDLGHDGHTWDGLDTPVTADDCQMIAVTAAGTIPNIAANPPQSVRTAPTLRHPGTNQQRRLPAVALVQIGVRRT